MHVSGMSSFPAVNWHDFSRNRNVMSCTLYITVCTYTPTHTPIYIYIFFSISRRYIFMWMHFREYIPFSFILATSPTSL